MADSVRALGNTWTYRDYRSWPAEERWEIIEGIAYLMAAPSVEHQRVLLRLGRMLADYLEGGDCEVLISPLDVLVFAPGETDEDEASTIVQPDLIVVCDKSGLNDNNLHGLPELVVEVLSPGSSRKDLHEKFSLYERRGVREYWVVDPLAAWFAIYCLSEDGKLKEAGLREGKGDTSPLPSRFLNGFSLDYARIFL